MPCYKARSIYFVGCDILKVFHRCAILWFNSHALSYQTHQHKMSRFQLHSNILIYWRTYIKRARILCDVTLTFSSCRINIMKKGNVSIVNFPEKREANWQLISHFVSIFNFLDYFFLFCLFIYSVTSLTTHFPILYFFNSAFAFINLFSYSIVSLIVFAKLTLMQMWSNVLICSFIHLLYCWLVVT